ncbi:MAG: TRAP transporter permease [Clostridia bacterium]|nr:TRAP transporter permease [Clostridia bacterium]
MAKYDRESATRTFSGTRQYIFFAICIIFSLVQLYAAFTAKIPATQLRPLHLGFVMLITYLVYPAKKKHRKNDDIPWYDMVLALLAMACCLYIVCQQMELAMRSGNNTTLDIVVGAVLVLLLMESCRRVVGYPILIIGTVFILYAIFGRVMPGFLAHRGFSIKRVVAHLVYTTEGIMGVPLGASATFIFLFVMFGAFLETTHVGQFFIDMANAIAGNRRGGPAKVAVLSSALMGTVSGSSVANTVGTGSFTIPMMKRLGYRPEFAGAVEAAASTGGQIMPPVMGAAAFLMAESVGVNYIEVAKAAVIPAILYFSGIWIIVELEARKYGLKGLSKEEMPVLKRIFLERGYLVIPLVVIVTFLCMGYTPIYAALIGIAAAAGCGMIRRIHAFITLKRLSKLEDEHSTEDLSGEATTFAGALKKTFTDIVTSLINGARSVVGVAIACGMAGIIVGMITLTGLGLKMGNGLTELAGGNQILTLMLTMLASIILGMGVPTTANYLITSTIMAPAVIAVMGWSMADRSMILCAHMFTFYFGIVADITPPVALAAMAGSAIAKSKPMRTGFNAVKLAIAAFLIPYMFVFNPEMLMINAEWYDVLRITVTALIGMFGIGAALEGYYSRHAHLLQRIMFLVGGLMLIEPGLMTDIIGIGLVVLSGAWQELENKRLGGRMEPSDDYYHGMSIPKRLLTQLGESFVMIVRLIKGEKTTAAQ